MFKNKVLNYTLSLAFTFGGASYASVPLYRIFCNAMGYGGSSGSIIQKSYENTQSDIIDNRQFTIEFNADVARGLPWKFKPTIRKLNLKAGETALTFYSAENQSDKNIVGIATYSIQPPQAAIYFNKIQCFCFEEQMLNANESVDMPVFFYLDKDILRDPKCKDVKHILLSYSFFKSTSQ
eukprot:NODE_32_length_37098_cov_1.132760.p20 type:complete len:180 gc:universal NODE_32_length_37098_cov_1.132760:5263-5802(+)